MKINTLLSTGILNFLFPCWCKKGLIKYNLVWNSLAALSDAKLTTSSSSSSVSSPSAIATSAASSSSEPQHQLLDSVSVIPCVCDSSGSSMPPQQQLSTSTAVVPPTSVSSSSCRPAVSVAEAVVMELLVDLVAGLGTATIARGSDFAGSSSPVDISHPGSSVTPLVDDSARTAVTHRSTSSPESLSAADCDRDISHSVISAPDSVATSAPENTARQGITDGTTCGPRDKKVFLDFSVSSHWRN